MNWQPFIFSDNGGNWAARHLLFFAIMGAVFYFQSLVPGQSIFETAFFSLCCFFPTCIFSVYYCLSFLFPSFIKKKEKLRFFLGFALLALVCLFINFHTAGLFLRLATDFGKPGISESEQMNLSFVNTSHALIIGGLALGIKFAKHLYWQQKENSMLSRRKIITDLRLEKTRIYPRLLYRSLNNMKSGIRWGSPDATARLLKVSELLSYILYDTSERQVPLDRELNMIRHLLDIEVGGQEGRLEYSLNVRGNLNGHQITPMTLFPLLENCLRATPVQKKYLTTSISIQDEVLECILAIELTGINDLKERDWRQIATTTSQGLDAINPDACRLDLQIDQGKPEFVLSVKLNNHSENVVENRNPIELSYA